MLYVNNMRFCIIDIHNMVHRAKHAVIAASKAKPFDPFADDEALNALADEWVGNIVTIVFQGIKSSFDKFSSDHCIAAFDRRSWRRDFYPQYKQNRRDKIKTPEDEANDIIADMAIDEIKRFLTDYTNVTVLEADKAEADDFIARWVQIHSDDEFSNVIVSSDSDFKQLVNHNTILFNAMSKILYTKDGVFHQDKRKSKKIEERVTMYGYRWFVKHNKKGEVEEFDPKWELFEKCIRGDKTDNIKTAWPRVYTAKMKTAFYGSVQDYNNFINSTWGKGEHKTSVRERYEFNKTLIDLTQQPDDIIELLDNTIEDAIGKQNARLIGAHFARFCAKYNMKKLLQQADAFNQMLSKKY